MLKKYLLVFTAFLITFSAFSQIKVSEPVSRLINSTLMHQVLNDFDRAMPLVFFAPGFFYVESVAYQNNPLFSESDYYDNEEMVRTSNYYQKEISDVLNTGFISYIPVDSIMQVRVIQGNTLLFELKFLRKADTLIFIQSDAEQKKTKSISYSGGKVIALSYNDIPGEITYNSKLLSDTLRVSELNDKPGGRLNKTILRFSRGLLSEISYYSLVSGKLELKSSDHYYYTGNNTPRLKQTLNRKGKITDSTLYFYDGDKLAHYKSFSGANAKLSITYTYNRAGKISGKTVKSPTRNYTVDYSYAGGNIAELEIDDKLKTFKRNYVFKTDISKRLAGVEYNTIAKESQVENLKTQWLFGYNGKGNINSVKVLDGKGIINKEIRFEYIFFGPDN